MRPDVSDLAAKALTVLAAEADRRSTGFFLMIEEEGIDTASHVNDLDRMTAAALRFDRAVEHAARFAAERGDTLVVVVSDHATGGITIDHLSEPRRDSASSGRALKHTGEPVAVYAYGPESAARAFAGRTTTPASSSVSRAFSARHRRPASRSPTASRASSAITSGSSSGQKSFLPSSRRRPRDAPKARSRKSGLSAEKIVSPVPHTIRVGTLEARRAGPTPSNTL